MKEQSLSHYRIVEKIGQGGMGDVYRATDTKLGRDVAIKTLPTEFARDPERRARFEREARLLASLNHPNIATLHGLEESDGVYFLVMELVAGETLAERIARAPLQLYEVIPLFKQIAEALDAAHEKGIVHRDLKPANVKITAEGNAKVLDFGLAKVFRGERETSDLSKSPTVTREGTASGVILGTAAYMSPEQARGNPVDKRTDIWSFGCVLFEALSGRKVFSGETASDAIAKILVTEPDWALLPRETPLAIRSLLRLCLEKDLNRRLRHMDATLLDVDFTRGSPETVSRRRAPGRAIVIAGGAVVVAVISAWLAAWNLGSRSPEATSRPLFRFDLAPPAGVQLALDSSPGPGLTLSSDGIRLVYEGTRGGLNQLYLRFLDREETTAIPGTEHGRSPFFSPDGEWIGFFADGKLKRVRVSGGSPETLCETPALGGAWAPDGTIILSSAERQGLERVPAGGGRPDQFTTPDASKGENEHRWPTVLPGGKTVLYTIWRSGLGSARIGAISLDTGEERILVEAGTHALYSPGGYLIYFLEGTLMAAPFDPLRLELTGEAVPMLEGVMVGSGGAAQAAISDSGSFVYVPSASFARQLSWVDRSGRATPVAERKGDFSWPRLSPDGRRLSVTVQEAGNTDLWVYDLARSTWTRSTLESSHDSQGIWTPDGARLIYRSVGNAIEGSSKDGVYWRPSDGSGAGHQLVGGATMSPISVTPDGETLTFLGMTDVATRRDMFILPLKGGEPKVFLQTPSNESAASFSPDGRWVAYTSDESGRFEIYVQPYPGPGGRSQVSNEGGSYPLWSRNGGEIFYRNGQRMMAIPVTAGASFSSGNPVFLFEGNEDLGPGPTSPNYDASADGGRFVMVTPASETNPVTSGLKIVLNWVEALKLRVSSTTR